MTDHAATDPAVPGAPATPAPVGLAVGRSSARALVRDAPPAWLRRTLVPALVGTFLVIGIAASDGLRAEDLTLGYQLGGLLVGTALAGVVAVVATGRGAPALAVLAAVLAFLPGAGSPTDAVSRACVLAALVAGSWLAVAARRARAARARALAAAPTVEVPVAPDVRRRFLRLSRWALVAGAAGVVAAALGGWLWQHDTRAADTFRARAIEVPGTVTVADDDAYRSTVRLDDGRTVVVPGNDGDLPARGTHVVVRLDPTDGRAELVDDVFDPTGAAGLLGIGAVVALAAVGGAVAARRRRVLALHGPAVVLDATPRAPLTVRLSAGGRPVAHARDAEPADGDRRRHVEAADGALGTAGTDADARAGSGADASTGTGDMSRLSDAELLQLASGFPSGFPSDDPFTAPAPPVAGPATVVGLAGGSGALAVRDTSGRWWLTRRLDVVPTLPDARSADDAAAADADAAAARARDDLTPGAAARAERGATGWERFWGRVDRSAGHALVPPLRASAGWLPWLVAPLLGALAWWLESDPEDVQWFGAIVLVVGGFTLGRGWAALGEPVVTLGGRDLGVAGPWLVERVPWASVVRVVADRDGLVIRLRGADGSEDAFLVPRTAPRYLLGTSVEPSDARDALEAARLRAVAGTGPATRVRRVPRSVWTGAWWSACVLAGLLVAARG